MSPYLAEVIGTAILILLGNGVVANVVLKKTNGFNSGWIVITFGWAIAVFIAVFIVSEFSGAHINPAVTIGLALAGKFAWAQVVPYILCQLLGAFAGACLVWLTYRGHYNATDDADAKKATFCTAPGIRNYGNNLFTEAVGTFILVFGVLFMATPEVGLGALDALPVALVVLGIGLSLGGPTGYAINPARDLGPRIAHALLPVKGKRDSDWGYAFVPILGPVIGAALAAGLFGLLS
ncbi:glycerol uptake facilitator protein [Anseongella ginsenosidimutans]|uniref:Glycerol uptake facilitator protein n=1 Tax=Anseongella ginsenosidimutans TaxID=496056 RepID=A0A4R3KRZ9_9SPHI|nr:MIP/aquaporin family protein [Anseongella ginsenosidimutans]QEC53193.1 aquaporin family protein [Anseongella ginsenosidimutans]TCS87822.1 glycerol uptake facilitator protein [Anseongella ginsenosidimutans]